MFGPGVGIGYQRRRRNYGANGLAFDFLPGQIIDDGSPAFIEPPVVVEIADGIKFKGRKSSGASGKFIYNIGLPAPGRQYTLKYDPDWSLLENGGVSAMAGFGFKRGNQFRVTGLKGDGSTGLKAYEIYGGNWNETSGFSTSDGGAAANGTQAGPNWLRLKTAANGATYTLQSSADGVTWTDEFTDVAPAPFADLSVVNQFGIAVFLEAGDAGPFNVDITLWTEAAASSAGDPYFANVVFLAGFDGADGATSYSEEKNSRAATFIGNAQLDTAQSKFGGSSILFDGAGDAIEFADNADWTFTGEFTIEGFARFTTSSASQGILLAHHGGIGARHWALDWVTSTHIWRLRFSTDGTNNTYTVTGDAGTSAADTWYHWAVDRDASNKIRLYVNGVMVASQTAASGSFDASANLSLGMQDDGIFPFNGWIDEVRITKGVARYASDAGFTPPTAAFPRS